MIVRLTVPAAALAAVAMAGQSAVAARPSPDRAYLEDVIGLSSSEIREIHAGQALTTTLSSRAGQEVVTFGAVRVRRPAPDVLRSLRSLAVSPLGIDEQRHAISQPTRPSDWSPLSLTSEAMSKLPGCRPGRCPVQLPAHAIARLRAGATDADVRQVVHDVVANYQRAGHRALQPYADRDPATSPSSEYRRLLSAAEYLPVPLAALRSTLDTYPSAPQVSLESDFYWSVQDFGMKPTLRVFHRVVADESAVADPAGHVAGAIATLQVLATHYFSSSLEWHIVVRDPTDSGAAFVYHLTRSWTPGLSGLRGAMARSSAKRNGREAVAEYLERARRMVEGERRGYDPFWETQP